MLFFFTMTKWVINCSMSIRENAKNLSDNFEKIEIREHRKNYKILKCKNKYQNSNHALDVSLPQQFSIIGKIRTCYPVVTLYNVFGVHLSS